MAPKVFEQGEVFTVPHLLQHKTSVFAVSSKALPQLRPLL